MRKKNDSSSATLSTVASSASTRCPNNTSNDVTQKRDKADTYTNTAIAVFIRRSTETRMSPWLSEKELCWRNPRCHTDVANELEHTNHRNSIDHSKERQLSRRRKGRFLKVSLFKMRQFVDGRKTKEPHRRSDSIPFLNDCEETLSHTNRSSE